MIIIMILSVEVEARMAYWEELRKGGGGGGTLGKDFAIGGTGGGGGGNGALCVVAGTGGGGGGTVFLV
jgi:hypothetical protein